MFATNRCTLSVSLAAVLAISGVTIACSAPPSQTVVVEKDHHWDDHENQAWHRFLTEKSRPDHEYTRADKNEQSEYWDWRHGHPD
jgi:carboxypeptidase C (cathepsin A)